MLWEAVLVGRENDPSFLLKALVNDIEKRYKGNNPYLDNEGKAIDEVKAKEWEKTPTVQSLNSIEILDKIPTIGNNSLRDAFISAGMYAISEKNLFNRSNTFKVFYEAQRKKIQDYYKKLISNQKKQKYSLSELNKEWIKDNRYWNPKDKSIDESKKKIFHDLGISTEGTFTGYDRPIEGFEDKFFGSKESLEPELKKLKERLEKEEKKTEKDFDNINFNWQTKEDAIKQNKKSIEYLKEEIELTEGRIAEGKRNQLSNKQLFSMYGGKAKFQKKINDSYVSAIKLLEQEDLRLFDENYKKMQTKIDKDISNAIKNTKPSPDMKDTITFEEVYSNIEGQSELTALKDLLDNKEMKQYLNLLSDKYTLPKKWDDMSDKEQNTWELDNKRKFQTNYQRLLKTLYALKNKYSADAPTSNKIAKVEAVIKTLNDRFNMKSWKPARKEAEEMKRESGTSLRRDSKESDFGPNKLKKPRPKKWKSMSFKEQQEWYSKNTSKNPRRKAAEESEMQNIYEVVFGDKEPLDKIGKNKKIKALLPSKEVDVTKPTREMWGNLLTKLEAFGKSKNPESQFNKLILSNELYLIDVINLVQTKRNNVYPKYMKLTSKKFVFQKPPKKKKDVSIGGTKTSQLSPTVGLFDKLEGQMTSAQRKKYHSFIETILDKIPKKYISVVKNKKGEDEERIDYEKLTAPKGEGGMGSAGQKISDELETEMSLAGKGHKYLQGLEKKIKSKKYKGLEDGETEEFEPTGNKDPRTESQRAWDKKYFRKAEVGSNKAAMKAREKKYAEMYKKATMANFTKLKEDIDKVKPDELDKYFNKTKSVMDADLFHWIDKTNKGISMRIIPYGEGDKDYSTIRKDVLDIMKILDKDMEYEGSEMKVLDVLNILGRKVYKKKAGSIVSAKKKEVSAKLKTIGEEAVRAVMDKDSKDFKIPRLLKLKLKQNNLKLKKEFYNIFTVTPTPDKTTKVEAMRIVEGTEELLNQLTPTEEKLLVIWEKVSDSLKATPEQKEARERQRVVMDKEELRAINELLEAYEDAIYDIDEKLDPLANELIEVQKAVEELGFGEREVEHTKRLMKKQADYLKTVTKKYNEIRRYAVELKNKIGE
tara:strand:+ start:18971 stop:22273 length:3303 start_codon:yes stop_codon:yes gene_type:complete